MDSNISWSMRHIIGKDQFPLNNKHGYRLVIKGLPGTGKTTLGLHFLHHHLINEPPLAKGAHSHGLIVYFQESPKELDSIAYQYGLDFKANPPDTQWVSADEIEKGFPFIKDWLSKRDEKSKLCILIDGLTILKLSDPSNTHKYLASLFTQVIRENILLIVLAEEELTSFDNYFDYMADAVINLTKDAGLQRHRFLEIHKMRYLDHIRGAHGFEMFQATQSGKSIMQIYPRVSCLSSQRDCRDRLAIDYLDTASYESGIHGLDEIIKGSATKGGFKRGDIFIVTVEPGTDKLGMGLSFLSPPLGPTQTTPGKTVWISFGTRGIFRSLTNDPYKSRFPKIMEQLIDNEPSNRENNGNFIHISRSNPAIHPDRIVYTLMQALEEDADMPMRVVVDGLSSLESEFDDPNESFKYIKWISQIIRSSNAVAIMFIDLQSSFTLFGSLEMRWSNAADFIGHLRWYEINNRLVMTFSLTKSRYDDFISFPYRVLQVKEGLNSGRMLLEDRGWPMASMLSGQMDQIHEAKVFFKLFDQNYSIRSIHKPILDDFKERYSSDQIFSHVFRSTPSPKHWSFREYAGAGHSNTKLVCLKQYILNILKEDNCLISFPLAEWDKYSLRTNDELPGKEYINSKSYGLWALAERNVNSTSKSKPGFSLPLYADLSVLCCQINKKVLIDKSMKEISKDSFPFEESVENSAPKTWNELFEMNKRFKLFKDKEKNSNNVCYHPPWIENIFAMPSLTTDPHCFFIFFLEILINFAKTDAMLLKMKLSSLDGFIELIAHSNVFEKTISLLREMVQEGVSKTPLEKIHYHNAYFSWRWFSQIDQYPIDDPRLPEIEKYFYPSWNPLFNKDMKKDRLDFSISPLPTFDLKENDFGISCLDFYSVAIIRGALAPETAFMFISELASSAVDGKRFEQRRGMPVIRENWSSHPDIPNRIRDREVIDKILENGRYFCNYWIPRYWHIESNLDKWCRKIFIRKDHSNTNATYSLDKSFLYSIKELMEELIIIINKENYEIKKRSDIIDI